jgi:hypothetical protein
MTQVNREQGGTTADVPAVVPPKCRNCGSTDTAQGPGAGPHHARLLCGNCGTFLRWLKKPATQSGAAEGTDWPSQGL